MSQISEKDKRALNSAKLLRLESKHQLSRSTTEMITNILSPLRNQPTQHGEMVIKILDILETNTTEDEILKKLKNSPSEAAYGETDATASSREFSNNSIPQNPDKSTHEPKKSKKNKTDSFIVRIVVDKNSKAISEISSFGVYAIKATRGRIFQKI